MIGGTPSFWADACGAFAEAGGTFCDAEDELVDLVKKTPPQAG